MAKVEDGRIFVEEILGRKWNNFPSRVAAENYHRLFLHDPGVPIDPGFKEKLLRLISKEDLNRIIEAHKDGKI